MRGSPHTSKEVRSSQVGDPCPDEHERLLIEHMKAGDHEAFEALFHQYFGTVYRRALRLLENQAEAEEVVQEVFLTMYEKVQTFRGDAAFSTWLYRITMNATLTKLRRRKRSEEVSLDEFLPRFREDGHHLVRPVVDWSNALEERTVSAEVHQLLQHAIDQLPPVDKAVVMLSDLEGLPDREIGAALGLSLSAVKSRLHRGRLFLRGKLAVSLGYSPS